MGNKGNCWEAVLSRFVPYLEWSELANGIRNSWDITWHNNAWYELHIILDGNCNITIENKEYHMSAGQAIIIAPNIFHAPSSVSGSFCRFTVSFVADEKLNDEYNVLTNDFPIFFDVDAEIRKICSDIFYEVDQNDSFLEHEMLSVLFSELMIRVFRTIKIGSIQHDCVHLDSYSTEEMLIIDRFFVTAPPEHRSRKELAALLHCSERQLIRKIYNLYGVSFREKMLTSRIDLAQFLLRSTSKSPSEISALVGYSDSGAFFRAFKAYTCMTPKEYRNKEKSQKA